jgi:hypothetical protein
MGIERDTPPTTMTKWLRLGNRIGNEVPQSKHGYDAMDQWNIRVISLVNL